MVMLVMLNGLIGILSILFSVLLFPRWIQGSAKSVPCADY